ncbi:MAG: hypothetical protein ACUVRO_04185 [Armatimonadota bacterium]
MATAVKPATSPPAGKVPLRQELEKLGYTLQWQGTGQPIKVMKGGQAWEVPPSQYSLYGGRAYVGPDVLADVTGYQAVRPYFEQKGWDVAWEGNKAQIGHPVTGETYFLTPPALWGGRTYAPPGTLKAIEKRLTPAYETTYADISGMLDRYAVQQQVYLQSYMNQMNQYLSQHSSQALAMMQAYQQQYADALDQLQQLLQPKSEVPESVKVAIDILRKQTEENVKKLAEEMNKRGIYFSGLAAEEERKTREQLTDRERQLLAQWLDEQHKQMFQAALEMARMQAQYAQSLPQLYETVYLKPLSVMMESAKASYAEQSKLASDLLNAAAELRKWAAEQEVRAREDRLQREAKQASAAQDLSKWLQEQALKQAQLEETIRHHKATEDIQRQQQATGSSLPSALFLLPGTDVLLNEAWKAYEDMLSKSQGR